MMSFFLAICRYCGSHYEEGMVGMTWIGDIHYCLGSLLSCMVVPEEDGAPMETMWDRMHRWPGTLCSIGLPG